MSESYDPWGPFSSSGYRRHTVCPNRHRRRRTVREFENTRDREKEHEWQIEWHARGPLKPAGVFVIQVLKLRELYNRSRLEHLVHRTFSEIGEKVTKGLLRRGLIEEYGSDVRLTRAGELTWVPEMNPELKRIVTEPYCKAACDPVRGSDWIMLVNVGHRHCTIDTLPEGWMKYHVERLIEAGLIKKCNGFLMLTKKGKKLLLPDIYPENPRSGNDWHRWKIGDMAWRFQLRYFHTYVNFGRLAVSLPDITVTPFSFKLRRWDKSRQFACEIESDPVNHPDNVRDNYFRNVAFGLPTLIVVRIERHRDAVIKAIKSLKDPKVLERTIKRARSLDAEQIKRATDWIRKHPPKMVTPNRLMSRHHRPATFAIDVEQVFSKPTREEIKAAYKQLEQQGCKFEILRKESGYYLTERFGRYREHTQKIEPWLVRWFIKRGAKLWGKG